MPDVPTLEQVRDSASKLAPQDQLRLIASLSNQLSLRAIAGDDNAQRARRLRMEAFLKLVDEHAADSACELNSAEDIRQIREERAARL